MKCLILLSLFLFAFMGPTASAMPVVVNLLELPREVNGFPDSTLTMTHQDGSSTGSNNSAAITETAFGTGSGFNRHEFLLVGSGVGSSIELEPFFDTVLSFQSHVLLSASSTATLKEAGIHLNGDFDPNLTGDDDDVFFMINSDGEIVSKGVAPYEFSTSVGEVVLDKQILMGVNIEIPSLQDPALATIQYFIDRGTGMELSPVFPLDLDASGGNSFLIKLYGQAVPDENLLSDTLIAQFENIEFDYEEFIPEPTMLVLATGCISLFPLAFGRQFRRRSY